MESRFYPGVQADATQLTRELRVLFDKDTAFEVQTMQVSATAVIQARKTSTLRDLTGLSAALTIKITPEYIEYKKGDGHQFTDSQAHQVALYLLDWDNYFGGRTETVEVLNTAGAVLDTRAVTQFQGGQYLVWNLSGHVVLRVTNTNGPANAVISGLFFGGGGAIAAARQFPAAD